MSEYLWVCSLAKRLGVRVVDVLTVDHLQEVAARRRRHRW